MSRSTRLCPQRTVAYVVPTRAFVNQITQRLRTDIAPLGFPVEAAIPVFEIDPAEDELLRRDINVLVVTPEKLDLLIRTDHPIVAELSLVVADEAHNIGTDARGARLELLLATLRRERSDARFLLLTPFVPNGKELALWLGGDGADATISIESKPSERVAALAKPIAINAPRLAADRSRNAARCSARRALRQHRPAACRHRLRDPRRRARGPRTTDPPGRPRRPAARPPGCGSTTTAGSPAARLAAPSAKRGRPVQAARQGRATRAAQRCP